MATWEVTNNHLVLTDIAVLHAVTKPDQSGFETELRSVLGQVFPDRKGIIADWFSGNIIVPDGKPVNYVHMGYASRYEKYIVLRVEDGIVTANDSLDAVAFAKFSDAQFEAFKKTDQFKRALAETAKEGDGILNAAQNEEFIREFYAEEYLSTIFERTQQR